MLRVCNAIAIGALAGLAAGCSEHQPAAQEREAFHVISGRWIEGAIVPGGSFAEGPEEAGKMLDLPVEALWTPTTRDVVHAEACIRRAVTAGETSLDQVIESVRPGAERPSAEYRPYVLEDIRRIAAAFTEYRAYYVGMMVAGRKLVYCNFFPKSGGDEAWKSEWVEVEDRGSWYWRIWYDVEADRVTGFDVNGDA